MVETPVQITTPGNREELRVLRAGDRVEITGDILVFRDQVHRLLCERLEKGEPLPFDLTGRIVYYCGPTPARDGMPVGSAGPTTSSRMDPFTPPLFCAGLAASIGKGDRSPAIAELMREVGGVYFAAVGGAGALLGRRVVRAGVIAYPELGPEAARMFTVERMPVVVGIDSRGESAFHVPERMDAGE